MYFLQLNAAHWPWLDALATCYDDPLRRDDVYARVREANREREFRAWARAVELSPCCPVC
jgi:hypothetical protein